MMAIMITEIETEYKKRVISFDQEREVWRCEDLNIEAEKLSAVKRRIDAIGHSERRVDVPALMLSRGRGDKAIIEEVRVTVLCDPARRRYSDAPPETTECWISMPHRSKARVRIEHLIPLDQRAEALEWCRLDEVARSAEKMAENQSRAITRHTADSLMLASKELKALDKLPKVRSRRRRAEGVRTGPL